MTSRRKFLASAGQAVLSAPFFNLQAFPLFAQSATSYSRRCIELMHRSLVIDMLSQFKLGAFPDVVPDPNRPTARWWSHPETFTPAEQERYRQSGINVFQIGWGTGREDAFNGAVKVIEAWRGFVEHFSHDFMLVLKAADFAALKQLGKIGILLGFQGSDHFRALEDIAFFYAQGQRVSQLTYNLCNAIGCGYEAPDTGLTKFGSDVIAKMNETGMAIDVSHCGPRTTLDAIHASRQPVLITHANCKALDPHSRNKSDEVIRRMAAGGGVMGITGVRMLVRNREPVTLEDVLDHFDHVVKLVGVEHVGVGSDIDLDGYDKLPPSLRAKMLTGYKETAPVRGDIDGLNHPQRMFDLTEGLIRRGYSDRDIELMLGGNFRRALAEIWQS